MRIFADMHNHTTFSDGKLSPAERAVMLKDKGAKAFAITDHDTVGGIEEGIEIAKKLNMAFSPAIEISTYTFREIHVLGYNIKYNDPDFLETLDLIKSFRTDRNVKLYNRLVELGIKLDLDPTEQGIGRVHFANAMVKAGYSVDVNDAFDTYLGNGKKAYVTAKRLTPLTAVSCIVKAGGVPVLAHPKAYLIDKKLDLLIEGLKTYGLKGLEVCYPSHNETDEKTLSAVAKKFGLTPTAGSDFHNPSTSDPHNKHGFTPLMEESDLNKLLPKKI